jgi:hypothetical protein
MGLGVLSYFFIPDFPDKNIFLSKAQTKFILQRIEIDRGDATPDAITWQSVLKHCSDWKNWVLGECFFLARVYRFQA